jgi:hypothetical protein
VRLAGRVGEADASGSAASGTGGGRPREGATRQVQ